MSLQLPQTPSYPVRVSPSHWSFSQTHSHFPLAWHWKLNPSQLSSTDLQPNFLLTAPHTSAPSSKKLGIILQPTWLICTRNINKTTEAHSAVIRSPTVALFFRIFHCCYLYSLLFHFCHCINIYSNWSGEQFCNWSSNMLYTLSWQ